MALVFVGGMSSLAVEMVAARLIAPFFGDSQFVWATLIGLTLIYLTAGYYLGGRLADHAPYAQALYRLTALAAVTGTPVARVLVVTTKADQVTRLSLRNAPGVHLLEDGQLNTRDVLVSDHVVFTQEALDSFVARATGAAKLTASATAEQEDEQQ